MNIFLYNCRTNHEKMNDIQDQISELEKQFSECEDFGERLEIRDKIHNLKLLLSGEKPNTSSEIECIGCGS